MKLVRIIPPPITAIVLVLIAFGLDKFIPGVFVYRSNLLAILLFLLGFVGGVVWPIILFKQRGATLNPNEAPKYFIDSGPYKISRNPMYLGTLLILISFALWQGRLFFFAPPLIYFILMDRFVIPYEEKMLKNLVDKNIYSHYFKKAKKWF